MVYLKQSNTFEVELKDESRTTYLTYLCQNN
jgi:hypothetical protein